MNTVNKSRFVVSILMPVAFLVACGGGGDNAGGPQSFTVNPTEITWSGPKDKCLTGEFIAGGVSTHVINGGVSPFRIISTHDSVFLPKTVVEGKDPTFEIDFRGSCASEFGTTVVVLDYHSRMVTVSIKTANFEGAPASTE